MCLYSAFCVRGPTIYSSDHLNCNVSFFSGKAFLMYYSVGGNNCMGGGQKVLIKAIDIGGITCTAE